MEIVHLTTSDPAGACIAQAKAINKFTDHRARVVTTRVLGYGWDADLNLNDETPETAPEWAEAKELIESADLVLIHKPAEFMKYSGGDFLSHVMDIGRAYAIYHHGEPGLMADPKKIVEWEAELGLPQIIVTPDMFRFMPGAYLLPNAVDVDEIGLSDSVNCDVQSPTVAQCSTGNMDKQVSFVTKALKSIEPVTYKIISGYQYQQCLIEKRKAQVGIDHFNGWWGISALEFCAMGIPCVVGLDSFCAAKLKEFFGTFDTPFYIAHEKSFVPKLVPLLYNVEYRKEQGTRGREYLLKHWEASIMAQRATMLYESLAS